jgi:competence/damage-inducible protein CinA-like protein
MLKIAMLSTGEEVLHGDIVDSNAAWASALMFEHGFALTKRSTVGDSQAGLIEELMMLSFNSNVLIVNGGLGPTTDDLTTSVAAEVADQPLVLCDSWFAQMKQFFADRGREMPESNIKQAMLPQSASMLDNPIGTACGFKMVINDCLCYFTPGVPSEFKLMMREQIIPDLHQEYPDAAALECSRLYTLGSSESAISDKLDRLTLPDGYVLGYRSYLPFIEVKLFGPKVNESLRQSIIELLLQHLSQCTVSINQPMLASLGGLLRDKNQKLALAEQSTRGWLANWLFDHPDMDKLSGSSWVLCEEVADKIGEHDVVASALALAAATREKSNTDLALVTGHFLDQQFTVALSTPNGEWAYQLELTRSYSVADRKAVIGTIAADLLRRYLSQLPMFADYAFANKIRTLHIPASCL